MTAPPSAHPPPEGFSPLADMRWIDCADVGDLLLAILRDAEVRATLRACGVGIDAAERAARAMGDQTARRPAILAMLSRLANWGMERAIDPREREAVDRILQRAMLKAGSSDGRVVRATDVLVSLLDDDECEAGIRLRGSGLTRYDALRFICHGLAKGTPEPDLSGVDGPASILLLDDNYTPMEAVVRVLRDVFGVAEEAATRIMLDVHRSGCGVVGVYDPGEARAKLDAVAQFGRDYDFPLRCVLDQQTPTTRGANAELLT